jgi:hypothetical protein
MTGQTPVAILNWSIADVSKLLCEWGMEKFAPSFASALIDGPMILFLEKDHLAELCAAPAGFEKDLRVWKDFWPESFDAHRRALMQVTLAPTTTPTVAWQTARSSPAVLNLARSWTVADVVKWCQNTSPVKETLEQFQKYVAVKWQESGIDGLTLALVATQPRPDAEKEPAATAQFDATDEATRV